MTDKEETTPSTTASTNDGLKQSIEAQQQEQSEQQPVSQTAQQEQGGEQQSGKAQQQEQSGEQQSGQAQQQEQNGDAFYVPDYWFSAYGAYLVQDLR